MKQIQHILNQVGLEAERVKMYNMSAAMAGQFVDATQEMTGIITALGPNPLRQNNIAGQSDLIPGANTVSINPQTGE